MLDETTYYFSAFALDVNGNIIDTQTLSITTDFWWHPSANTLFYIKNDWDVSDYSSYNHTMNTSWTTVFTTLSNWRKVYYWDWNKWVYSNRQFDCRWKTTFTLHCWFKWISINSTNETTLAGWMSRNWTWSDRWGAKFQTPVNTARECVIYWPNYSDWIRNDNIWIDFSTTEFILFTFTINWNSVLIYKNWNLVWSWTWNRNIQWWVSIWDSFYYWWAWSYVNSWESISNSTKWYRWEIALEDKVETQAEITNFYDKTKKHYS